MKGMLVVAWVMLLVCGDVAGAAPSPAPQRVQFPDIDGKPLYGRMYKPDGDGPFPAVIWNHGSDKTGGRDGAAPFRVLGNFYASHGYVAFFPYRHNAGWSPPSNGPHATRLLAAVAKHDECRAQEVMNEDVAAAVRYLMAQPFVDRHRVAMSGCSYGGIQTLISARHGQGLACFIPFAPAAMSWGNRGLRNCLIDDARRARAPILVVQAANDFNTAPSKVLGEVLRRKGGLNGSKVFPPYGNASSHHDGHWMFAVAGVSVWGEDVLRFLRAAMP